MGMALYMLCSAFYYTCLKFFSPFADIRETDFDVCVECPCEYETGSTVIEFEISIILPMPVILFSRD